MLSVKPNITEEISNLDAKTESEATSGSPDELQQEQGVQCISIDGSCKKNGTENAVAVLAFSGETTTQIT